MKGNWLLAWWMFLSFVWDGAVIGCCGWLVFFLGQSGWWFLLAAPLIYQETFFKVMAKRFGVK